MENNEKKTLVIENGELKVSEKRSYPIALVNKMCFQLTNTVKTGKCACCGGESLIFFQGNIVAFGCDGRNAVKNCVFHENCPGIDFCQNKEDFDPSYSAFKKARLKEILDKMFGIFDVVMVMIENESKDLVADVYLKTKEFVVRTWDTGKDSNMEDFYVISKSKAIEENRKKLEKLVEDRKIEFDKAGGDLKRA